MRGIRFQVSGVSNHDRQYLVLRFCLVFTGCAALLFATALIVGRLTGSDDELVFTSYASTNPDIYRMDVGHFLRVNLTQHEGYDSEPAWSPDGNSIAFVSDRDGRIGVYIMAANGEDVRRVIAVDTGTVAVNWSSDGQRLYLFSFTGNQQLIFTVNLDGSGYEQVNEQNARDAIQRDLDIDPASVSGSISPDGQYRLFSAFRGGTWGIYVSDTQRRNARRLADAGRQYAEAPVWSRGGRYVAFIALTSTGLDLFVIDPLGAAAPALRLTQDANVEANVSWRP
jgi:TolB protein